MPNNGLANASDQVRIQMLGGFRVSMGRRVLPESAWRLPKAKSIVKLLALAPGHRLPRDEVMELLWPRSQPERLTTFTRRYMQRGAP